MEGLPFDRRRGVDHRTGKVTPTRHRDCGLSHVPRRLLAEPAGSLAGRAPRTATGPPAVAGGPVLDLRSLPASRRSVLRQTEQSEQDFHQPVLEGALGAPDPTMPALPAPRWAAWAAGASPGAGSPAAVRPVRPAPRRRLTPAWAGSSALVEPLVPFKRPGTGGASGPSARPWSAPSARRARHARSRASWPRSCTAGSWRRPRLPSG